MLDNLKKYKVILASNSPRRRELMDGLGIDYSVKVIKGIDESYSEWLRDEEIPLYIAGKKAEAYRSTMGDNELVITADTVVWNDGKILGKPADRDEAICMLRSLSGKTHEVITAVCLMTKEWNKNFTSSTDVTFDNLTDEEIEYYVDRYSPMDKAGAYGVQEWIGFIGVKNISGSYFNVMGLPIQKLYGVLKTL
jgi:septum formation protein